MRFLSAVVLSTMIFVFLMGDFCTARQVGEKPASPSLEEAIIHLRSLQLQRDFDYGVHDGKKLIQHYPQSVELQAWYIASMARDDMEEEAVSKAEKLVEDHPENPWSYFALARALNSHDERGKEAIAVAEKALSMKPEHPDFLWMYAAVLSEQKGDKEAIIFVDSVRSGVKNPAELLAMKGNMLMALSWDNEDEKKEELFEKAIKAFDQAREADSTCVDAYYLPGYYYNSRKEKQKAYSLLKKATELSTALRIHYYFWRSVRSLDARPTEEKEKIILADIASLEKRRPVTAEMLFRFANQYGQLEMEEKKLAFEQRILDKYPKDVYAEWVLVSRYRDYEDEHREALFEEKDSQRVNEYKQMLWDFINRPHHNRETLIGDAYRNLFYMVREDSTVDPQTLLKIVNGMVEYEGINLHITHSEGAKILAEHGADYRRAEEIVRNGLVLAREKVEDYKERGVYDSEEDYQNSLNWYTGLMYDALGWVFFQEGRLDSAAKYLGRAYSLDPENEESLYHLGQLHEKKGELEKAREYYVKGIGIKGRGENPNEGALEMLYIKRNGSPEGYEAFLTSVQSKNLENRKEKILADRIKNPEKLTSFTLKRLDGSTFSSEELRGKTAVINHWGLWCGPCVAEMPDIQKLHEKYVGNPDVTVLTINNDPSIERVQEWMKEKKYNFIVLRDNGYLSQEDVHTFPTTWFVDPVNYIAYIKIGFTEKLVEEFTWRIEDLAVN